MKQQGKGAIKANTNSSNGGTEVNAQRPVSTNNSLTSYEVYQTL